MLLDLDSTNYVFLHFTINVSIPVIHFKRIARNIIEFDLCRKFTIMYGGELSSLRITICPQNITLHDKFNDLYEELLQHQPILTSL